MSEEYFASIAKKRSDEFKRIMYFSSLIVAILSIVELFIDLENALKIIIVNIFLLVLTFLVRPYSPEIHHNYSVSIEAIFNNETVTINVSRRLEGLKWHVKKISEIKQIIDCGDYYCLFTKNKMYYNAVGIEKRLLVKGTIEEFEKLFEGKIIRKVK